MHIEPCPLCGYDVTFHKSFVYREFSDPPIIKCTHCGVEKKGGVFREEYKTDKEAAEDADKLLLNSWNNQTRIKDIERDLCWLVDHLKKIRDIPPHEYTDDEGIRLSCAGCNEAAVIALKALKEIPERYKNEDSI